MRASRLLCPAPPCTPSPACPLCSRQSLVPWEKRTQPGGWLAPGGCWPPLHPLCPSQPPAKPPRPTGGQGNSARATGNKDSGRSCHSVGECLQEARLSLVGRAPRTSLPSSQAVDSDVGCGTNGLEPWGHRRRATPGEDRGEPGSDPGQLEGVQGMTAGRVLRGPGLPPLQAPLQLDCLSPVLRPCGGRRSGACSGDTRPFQRMWEFLKYVLPCGDTLRGGSNTNTQADPPCASRPQEAGQTRWGAEHACSPGSRASVLGCVGWRFQGLRPAGWVPAPLCPSRLSLQGAHVQLPGTSTPRVQVPAA